MLAAVVGVVAACGPSEEQLARSDAGRRLYEREGCIACHGRDLRGTATAPSLRRVGRHWSEDDLVRFLADPAPWLARERRLRRLHEEHTATMPGVPYLSEEQRRDLAVFLMVQ